MPYTVGQSLLRTHVGGCQSYGAFLGPYFKKGAQKGMRISTTTHVESSMKGVWSLLGLGLRVWTLRNPTARA